MKMLRIIFLFLFLLLFECGCVQTQKDVYNCPLTCQNYLPTNKEVAECLKEYIDRCNDLKDI